MEKTDKNGKEILLSSLKIGILEETRRVWKGETAMPKSKGKILYILQAINIIPLFFLGILILLLGTHWFTRSMYAEVESGLANVSRNLTTTLDALYPGDYRLVGGDGYQLYKGETNLTADYTLIDQIKENTGLEVTLFYQDTRILTTIRDSEDKRIVGSGAPEAVVNEVLKTGEPRFYTKAIINHSTYFCYYVPLVNSDGTTAGMLFVGKPTAEVDNSVQESIIPLMIADIILMLVIALFIFLYTRKIVSALLQIHRFMEQTAQGNLDAAISPAVLKRNDELGGLAHSALDMQRSLHTLIGQDALTSLANRRSASKRLQLTAANAKTRGHDFCIALGDIDFFKKINDTYGHDCGDMVLKNIASKLLQHMQGHGMAARWGGEEFLLIFERADEEQAFRLLAALLDDIRTTESEYDGQRIKVTMTFGLAAGITDNVTELLCAADHKLYIGKNGGRNRIVR